MSDLWIPPSPTACKLKWAWSTIFLNSAKTKSCFHNPTHSFDTQTFNFHNIPIKVEDRREMLDGKWPDGCAYCKKIEDVGGQSDRQSQNNIPALIPEDLGTETAPKILEVFFNNTCNLSCLYCGPMLSSTWAQEINRYGTIDVAPRLSETFSYERDEYVRVVDRFFEWLDKNGKSLERLHVLGGEPFLLKETTRLLSVLETSNSSMEIAITTNLMIDPVVFTQYIQRLTQMIKHQNVSSVTIIASIDGWGKAAEFQRTGLDLELWEKNFQTVLNEQLIKLDINLAMTCLTIPTMPELIAKWNEWCKIKEVGLHGMQVFNPNFLAPHVLPAYHNKEYFQQAIDLIPEDTWGKKWAKERFSSLLPVFDKYQDGVVPEMRKLKTFLNEISQRRSMDWTTTFPKIYQEIKDL